MSDKFLNIFANVMAAITVAVFIIFLVLIFSGNVDAQVRRKKTKIGGKPTPSGSPADKQILIYNDSTNSWKYGTGTGGGVDSSIIKSLISDSLASENYLDSNQISDLIYQNAITFPKDDLVYNWDSSKTVFRYYVDGVNGNDNLSGKMWSEAKKTLQAATDAVPKNARTHWVYIFVKPGNYAMGARFLPNISNSIVKFIAYTSDWESGVSEKALWGKNDGSATTNDPITISSTSSAPITPLGDNVEYWFESYNPDNNEYLAERWVWTAGASANAFVWAGGSRQAIFVGNRFDLSNSGAYGVYVNGSNSITLASCSFYGGAGNASLQAGNWRGAIVVGNGSGRMVLGKDFTRNWKAGFTPKVNDGLYFEDIKQAINITDGVGRLDHTGSLADIQYHDNVRAFGKSDIRISTTAKGFSLFYKSSDFNLVDNSDEAHTLKDLTTGENKIFLSKNIIDNGANVFIENMSATDPNVPNALWNSDNDVVLSGYTKGSDVLFKEPVASIPFLKAVTTPADGETRQVLDALPDLMYYTFNTDATDGEVADDGTPGKWHRSVDFEKRLLALSNSRLGYENYNAGFTLTEGLEDYQYHNYVTANSNVSITHNDPASGSAGELEVDGQYKLYTADDYININPEAPYRAVLKVKCTQASDNGAKVYLGLIPYDNDKNRIAYYQVNYQGSKVTTLTQAINNGDTEIHLADATGWDVGTGVNRDGVNCWRLQSNGEYAYKSPTGKQYDELGYTRKSGMGFIDNVDLGTNIVTLKRAWNLGSFPAGTKVAPANNGGTYVYYITGQVVPNDGKYHTYKSIWRIGEGKPQDNNGKDYTGNPAVRNGTSYIKILGLFNYGEAAGNNVHAKYSIIGFEKGNSSNEAVVKRASFMGTSTTFANLPTSSANGVPAISGDYARLMANDGANLAGIYYYQDDNTYLFGYEIPSNVLELTDAQMADRTELQRGLSSPKQISDLEGVLRAETQSEFYETEAAANGANIHPHQVFYVKGKGGYINTGATTILFDVNNADIKRFIKHTFSTKHYVATERLLSEPHPDGDYAGEYAISDDFLHLYYWSGDEWESPYNTTNMPNDLKVTVKNTGKTYYWSRAEVKFIEGDGYNITTTPVRTGNRLNGEDIWMVEVTGTRGTSSSSNVMNGVKRCISMKGEQQRSDGYWMTITSNDFQTFRDGTSLYVWTTANSFDNQPYKLIIEYIPN